MRGTTAPLRLVLRASLVLYLGVVVLSVLAALALDLSRMPVLGIALVPCLAVLALGRVGAGLPLDLVLRHDGSATRLDLDGHEHPVQPVALHERGPLGVFVVAIDGRRHHLPWAADSVPRPMRRALRLWLGEHVHTPVASASETSAAGVTAKSG